MWLASITSASSCIADRFLDSDLFLPRRLAQATCSEPRETPAGRSKLQGREDFHNESNRKDHEPRDSRELAPEEQQHDGACHHPESIGDGKGHQGLAGDRLAVAANASAPA